MVQQLQHHSPGGGSSDSSSIPWQRIAQTGSDAPFLVVLKYRWSPLQINPTGTVREYAAGNTTRAQAAASAGGGRGVRRQHVCCASQRHQWRALIDPLLPGLLTWRPEPPWRAGSSRAGERRAGPLVRATDRPHRSPVSSWPAGARVWGAGGVGQRAGGQRRGGGLYRRSYRVIAAITASSRAPQSTSPPLHGTCMGPRHILAAGSL